MDADKPKHKSGYRQNRELALLCGLWLLLTLFSVDWLLGAVGVWRYYETAALIVALALGIVIVALVIIWRVNLGIVGFVVLVSALCILSFTLNLVFLLIGDFNNLRRGLLIVGFILSLAAWMFGLWAPRFFDPDYVKAAILIMGVYLLLFFVGTWFNFSGERFVADAHFANHYYYLGAYEDLGDPAGVYLYECNQYGLDCHQLYKEPVAFLYNRTASLMVNEDTGRLDLMVDDQLLYRHAPS